MSMITIEKPYEECVLIYGMRQEGKSNWLAYTLLHNPNRYILFDTIGVHKWEPRFDNQEIIRPRFGTKEQDFIDLCKRVWRTGNTILIIEEADQFQSIHYLPPELDTLINMGHNRKIALWFVTRRLADLHKDIVANCHHHIIFRAYVPQDIEYYRKFIGRIIDYAQFLKPYHFIYYQIGRDPIFFKPVPKVI